MKKELKRWFNDNGPTKYRYGYNLNSDSIVFDVGAYRGEFARKIIRKFNCNVYMFEPVKSFYEHIKINFSKNQKIKVFNYGLSSRDQEMRINVDGDASSTFVGRGKNFETIKLRDFEKVIYELQIDDIDLIKINIEGGEYDLLDYFINNNLVSKMKNIQIQFHSFVPNADNRRAEIRKLLCKTHKVTYDYDYVWENWERLK